MQTNIADFAIDVPSIFQEDGDVDVAVAFVSEPGLALVRLGLQQKLESGRRIRLLFDLEEGATDPTALWELVALNADFPANLLLKAYVPDEGILHSKVYISGKADDATLITGSANLSRAALLDNVEHGVRLVGSVHDDPIRQTMAEFEQIWNSEHAYYVDDETARLYEIYSGLRRAALARGRRRARGSWQNLKTHLAEVPVTVFDWPSVRTAFMVGAITARGQLHTESHEVSIPLLFKANAYKNGRVTVRNESFEATEVLPTIPQAIADNARSVFPNAKVSTDKMRVDMDFQDDTDTFEAIASLFRPRTDCDHFHLPTGLSNAEDSVVAGFIRGFAVSSALLTDATSMPANSITGLPGQMVVWLRPKQNNPRLYDQLATVINRRLHITLYHHRRIDRDPHMKLLCEEFQEIGFGIDWWDRLVNAGAEYNQALFPQG